VVTVASTQCPLTEILSWHPLAELAWRAAHEAATFLHTQRPADLSIETKSTPTDVVTLMDKSAEHLLIERLLGERPGDGMLGEEGADHIGTTGIRWIVDPLDGTVNYLYRIPLWGVSVAAEDTQIGGVVVGVIVLPELDEGFIGVLGHGAWRIKGDLGESIGVSDCSQLGQALIGTGFGYAPQRRALQGRTLAQLIPSIRDIRRTGSAVVDFTWLARGLTDGYYERGLGEWDMAAGMLIAQEAGAQVMHMNNNTFVAAVPGIVDELLSIIQSTDLDK
jgi:myo-inositol-1(or 4)-monophosphatase